MTFKNKPKNIQNRRVQNSLQLADYFVPTIYNFEHQYFYRREYCFDIPHGLGRIDLLNRGVALPQKSFPTNNSSCSSI